VFGRTHLSHDSLSLWRHDSQGGVSKGTVDAIELPAGGVSGKKLGIRFQSYQSPPRRRAPGRIPDPEVRQDPFDDRRVFDEADDA
jgi:hypothetical protein